MIKVKIVFIVLLLTAGFCLNMGAGFAEDAGFIGFATFSKWVGFAMNFLVGWNIGEVLQMRDRRRHGVAI